MKILSNPIAALNVRESPKFPRLKGNRVAEHDGDVRF